MRKKMHSKQKADERKVNITLDEYLIKYLLGAVNLGITLEDLCAYDAYSYGTVDTHSLKWQLKVLLLYQEIIKQTGVIEVYKEYGDWFDKTGIAEYVSSNCKKREELSKTDQE